MGNEKAASLLDAKRGGEVERKANRVASKTRKEKCDVLFLPGCSFRNFVMS